MGPPELLIVAIIAVAVLFGAKKIPEIARSVGRAQGEFKKGIKEGHVDEDPAPVAPPAVTPPAVTPPAVTPPAVTPPVTPPAATAPAEPAPEPETQA